MVQLQFESQTTYTFLEEIGRGGMGVVYLAERNSGGVIDYVVLKTFKSFLSEDEDTLRQEANLAALLRHENIVKTYGIESISVSSLPQQFVHDLEEQEAFRRGASLNKVRRIQFRRRKNEQAATIESATASDKRLLLIVMDYIDGIDLRALHSEHISQSLLIPVTLAAFIVSRIARALAYAHNYLVHRDISPENILVNTQGICKLTDFGIAVGTDKKPKYWAGKLSYMAPEQVFKQPIDERADIFSLGSVAYQLITGIPIVQLKPNQAFEDQIKWVKSLLSQSVVPPEKVRSDIPKELSDIIMKMVSPSPYKRYQRIIDVASDLEKKFLYARGFGPTNNSLATYLKIFENKFSDYDEEQLQQLSFMKNENGEIQLKRNLTRERYTPEALQMLELRKYSEIYQKLRVTPNVEQLKMIQKSKTEEKIPFVKIKHLDNVIESVPIKDPLIIGQKESNQVVLEEEGIANKHCAIYCKGPVVKVKIADPKYPVLVNGNEITKVELRDGDKVSVGSYSLFLIRQRALRKKPKQTLKMESDTKITHLAKESDFLLAFRPEKEQLKEVVKLIEEILGSTNLSELKRGIIPTALVESIQLLKGSYTFFQLHIIRTSMQLVFSCIGISKDGYATLIETFKKHRQKLLSEIQVDEAKVEDEEAFSAEDLFSDGTTAIHRKKEEAPEEDIDFDNLDIDLDIDLDGDLDLENATSMLAALMMVHAFDRIEFRRGRNEVELVVNL